MLITFNPSTREDRATSVKQFTFLLKAIEGLKDTKFIFTKPNPDMYSGEITQLIEGYVLRHKDRAVAFIFLGRELYLHALSFTDVVAGNSSSGIIEAPSLGIPTVNIGNRQKGRLMPHSVICVNGTYNSVKKAIAKAFSQGFKKRCARISNPYGKGNTARQIVSTIKRMDFSKTQKRFFDLPKV